MSGQTDPAATLSNLVFEQAGAALTEQQRLLESLRNRSGTLLTGATISTSFLGGQALARGSLHVLSWLAIGCFVVVGLSSLAILWPRRAIELSRDPRPTAAAHERRTRDDDPILAWRLAITEHRRVSLDRNDANLARIATYLRTGVTFLAFEVVWWVADLATRA